MSPHEGCPPKLHMFSKVQRYLVATLLGRLFEIMLGLTYVERVTVGFTLKHLQ